jgi:hypothetical protein
MTPRFPALCFGVLIASAAPLCAQSEMQQKVAQIKESIQANQAALRTYTWQQHTQILYKGEAKSRKDYSVVMGADGKPQKTNIDAPPPPPEESHRLRGRLREKIKDEKIEELKQYMQQAQQLIEQYVPPSGQKVQDLFHSGSGSLSTPGPNLVRLTINNYVQQGDALILTYNQKIKKMVALNVNTYLPQPKDTVRLQVTFAYLPDGTTYPATITLTAKAKDIEVVTTNNNYQKM